MIVSDFMCGLLDDLWGSVENLGLFDIPILGNIISAIINWYWGLCGCDFWT